MSGIGDSSRGSTLTNTAMFWLAMAIASVALWPIYQSVHLVIVVLGALVLGSAIAIVGARRRWSSLLVAAATIVVYLLSGVPLAVPTEALYGVLPTLEGERDLIVGTATSWKQLVTVSLPVGSYQALLVPALIVLLLSTVAGLSIALRSHRPEAASLAPMTVFVMAIFFGPSYSTWPLPMALGLIGVLVSWLGWQRANRRRATVVLLRARAGENALPDDKVGAPQHSPTQHSAPTQQNSPVRRGPARLRSALTVGLIATLVSLSAIAGTVTLAPAAARTVIRTTVVQPFDSREHPSPLSGFRSYLEPATAEKIMLQVRGLPEGSRIRIATLDSYDGVIFSVGSATISSESGTFVRVPFAVDQSALQGTPVSLDVTVDGYAGLWLPTVGKFESVKFVGNSASAQRNSFYYNDTSGTAAVLTPLSAGDHYSLTAVVPRQPSAAELTLLTPGAAASGRMPALPQGLSTTIDDWTERESSLGSKLAAVIAAIKSAGYISHGLSAREPASRSGHAADRITELLTAPRMIGDQEQYAVTAALMARELGFPARVVLGFVPKAPDAAGITVVRGEDISAWIEVNSARWGWVSIDPTPAVRPIPPAEQTTTTSMSRPQSPVQAHVPPPPVKTSATPPDHSQENVTAPNAFLRTLFVVLSILGWVVVGVMIVLVPFAVIAVSKIRRRMRRLRARGARDRIRGGWLEFEDTVLDYGHELPNSPTRTEIAQVFGGTSSRNLAVLADRAAFAPGMVDDDEARQAWVDVMHLRAALGAGLTRWQRIRAAISLRSLGSYGVNSLFRR